MGGGIPWPKTGAIQYRAQSGLPDKGSAIKGFVVCNNCDLEPLGLLNGLALGYYHPSPEVFIVYWSVDIHTTYKHITLVYGILSTIKNIDEKFLAISFYL